MDGPARRSVRRTALEGGDRLLSRGDPARRIHLLRSGLLAASGGPAGETRLLGLVHPGEAVGEMAVLAGTPHANDVTAIRDSVVDSLDADDFLQAAARRPEVMAQLADWNAGDALGDDMRDRVRASSALAVITVTGGTLRDYAAGGSAVEAVWVHAQQHGLAVQPVSPVWLFAQDTTDLTKLSARFADELGRLQREFIDLAGAGADERIALILRLTTAAPSAVTSRRSADRIRLPQ